METLLTYFVIVAVGIKMGGKGDPFFIVKSNEKFDRDVQFR